MTRTEIDHQLGQLQRLRYESITQAFELAERLIDASKKNRYSEHLPLLHLYRADLLVRLSRRAEAEKEYQIAYKAAERAGDTKILGRVIAGQASIKVYRYDLPAGKELLERAISLAISSGDTEGQGIALSFLANVYCLWGLPELGTGYARDSYELLKGTRDVTFPLYRLGVLSDIAGDRESAKRYFLEGLAAIDKYHIPTGKASYHGGLGIAYAGSEEYEKAGEQYQLAIKAAEAVGDIESALTTFVLLGYNDILKKDLDAGEEKLHQAIRQNNGLRKRMEFWAYQYLAVVAQKRGNISEAIAILDKISVDSAQHVENAFTEGIYNIYIDCYTAAADWQKVAFYEKKLREFKNEIDSSQFKSNLTTAQALIAAEREKHDKELEKMKREQLERELSNTTLQLLAQTEALAEFREGILAVVRRAPPTEPIARELREKLKVLPCKSIDWDIFEAQFKAAHPEFRLKLIELYPDLTKMELRICTLIRMNLKSDDISRLTCLSERNIENHRYRIRKKMKLVKEQDLALELAKM